MRPASELVKIVRKFRSSVSLRFGEQIADARSILAILMLCATCGSVITLEVSGEDEDSALAAIEEVFVEGESDDE